MFWLSTLIFVMSYCIGVTHCETGILHLPGSYQDGMVLQSDRDIQIYGFSRTDRFQVNVTVTCDGSFEVYNIKTTQFSQRIYAEPELLDQKGHFMWTIPLAQKSNGQECQFRFEQDEDRIDLNVIYGDVWVCSGQSNMYFPMKRLENTKEEIEIAKKYDNIKMFKVFQAYSSIPRDDIALTNQGTWIDTSHEAGLLKFSALCFLYAR